jgi:flavin-dependent dehydrogenase
VSAAEYDVVIAGASTAGCTAARLFGLRGARVALVERKPSPTAFKTVCTHFIQPSATPTIKRLGLDALIEERGAVHNSVDFWTPYGGWIEYADPGFGYNVTRRTLDPLLRELATGTPGVDYLPGRTVVGVRPGALEAREPSGATRRITARLVVGADGRDSTVARLARVPGRVKPHNRFFYWAYWRGVRAGGIPATRSRVWFMEPDTAYTFPNEDGLTLVLVGPHRDRLPAFRENLAGAYMSMVSSLPDAPDMSGATREGKLLGKLDLPNVFRSAARPGLALVGDAALASDPLWGVGCGWAFQSAEWLVDETGDALLDRAHRGELEAALERYRKLHFRRLGAHHWAIADLSSGRPANPFEKMMYRAAARDRRVAGWFGEVGGRKRPPAMMLRPDRLARIVAAGRGA